MLSRTVLAIGLLACASHITNAYILLSANIEDIKKVASKFLSSSVVEQLTNLISKFKTDTKINLSEENNVNEKNINKVSDDEIEERAPYDKPINKIPKDETGRDRYKIANKISHDEDTPYTNALNQVKDAIDRDMFQTPRDLIEREISNRQFKKETVRHDTRNLREIDNVRPFKKEKVRDDLYWNDNVGEDRVERLVATSGHIKLPYSGKRDYNWEISSDN